MTLRIGIVGAGRAGFRRARRLKAYPDVEITAVADPNRPSRDAFARTFGTKLAVSDHNRLAFDQSVDVVYICSPPTTHSTIAVDALEAGRHVICEQPMATTLNQAEEMLIAAEASSGRLFVALPQRYDPVNQEAARYIDSIEIGYPFMVLGSYIKNEFDRLNDWHNWKGTWDIGGGGVLMQYGSEMVDLLLYLFGEVDTISAICTRFAVEPLNKAEDSCILSLEFMEEIAGELAITGAARYSPWPEQYADAAFRLDIFGVDGSIQINSHEPKLIISSKKNRRKVLAGAEIVTDLPTDMDRDFLDCILEDRESFVTIADALDALKVVLSGYKSSQMKRRVGMPERL